MLYYNVVCVYYSTLPNNRLLYIIIYLIFFFICQIPHVIFSRSHFLQCFYQSNIEVLFVYYIDTNVYLFTVVLYMKVDTLFVLVANIV